MTQIENSSINMKLLKESINKLTDKRVLSTIKVCESLYILIPIDVARALDIEKGDLVEFRFDIKNKRLVYRKRGE